MAASKRAKPQTGPRAAGGGNSKAPAKTEAQKARDEALDTSIVVDGVPYRLGDLELGELAELEDHTGLPMDMISYGSAKVIMFVVYLVRRRTEPDYSLADAGRIKIDKVSAEGTDDDGNEVVAAVGDPTAAPGESD